MQFVDFTIKNYKGIKECKISVDRLGSRVFSLVGLNESGKTTILEAINEFIASDQDLQNIYENSGKVAPKSSFVPKSRKANFNGEISISANVRLEKSDIEALERAFSEAGYVLDTIKEGTTISVVQAFEFENSDFKKSGRRWSLSLSAKSKTGKPKFKKVDSSHPAWQAYWSTTEKRLPLICYFPTFLFEFPDRIYIEEHSEETPANSYYRRLFQDILDSLDDDLNTKKHIVDRIRSSDAGWSWFNFLQTDRREQVNHVMLRASAQVTKVILASWKRVFNKTLDNKRVEIEYGFDESADAVYIKMFLVDGSEKYAIGNRSLGFRWFFCFWLFTYFRTLREGGNGVVFLLDEPASNLHARAQEELLGNLGALAGKQNVVIYSTHSHYLINPNWLDSAYIITNGAVSYGGVEDEFDSNSETNIKATPYRSFVAKHPNQRNYFLPVLDALEYKPSNLTFERPSLLVEGKADFAFFKAAWGELDQKFSIIPGNGAKSLDPLIGILTGWGVPFVIILDDDKEGRDAKKKYEDSWGITGRVRTLESFDGSLKNQSLETTILVDCGDTISKHFGVESPQKLHVQSYLYEKLAVGGSLSAGERLESFSEAVRTWVEQELGS